VFGCHSGDPAPRRDAATQSEARNTEWGCKKQLLHGEKTFSFAASIGALMAASGEGYRRT
jgi:hypothetical protein